VGFVGFVGGEFNNTCTKNMKRKVSSTSSDTSGPSGPDSKRRNVSYATFLKWKTDLDCTKAASEGKKIIAQLRCDICANYESSIATRRNYSDKWISGADSVRTSNIRDHSKSDQHIHAMNLLRRDQAKESGETVLLMHLLLQL
jgi:hypothetical protein